MNIQDHWEAVELGNSQNIPASPRTLKTHLWLLASRLCGGQGGLSRWLFLEGISQLPLLYRVLKSGMASVDRHTHTHARFDPADTAFQCNQESQPPLVSWKAESWGGGGVFGRRRGLGEEPQSDEGT